MKTFNLIKLSGKASQIAVPLSTEQNVQFQLDQIQNGRLEVIIDINMDNIGKTVPDS